MPRVHPLQLLHGGCALGRAGHTWSPCRQGLGPAWPPALSRQPVPHEAVRAERGTRRLHSLGQWFPEKDSPDGCWFPDQNRLTTTSEAD